MDQLLLYLNIINNFINWRVFFDVPILALMMLFLYRTMKTSGSWRIALGLVIIISVYILSHIFNFAGVVWIFDKISNIALLALIIIFQPEIRKIFERTASTLKIKKLLKHGETLSNIITESVFKIASNRWGAIIILPGKDSLESKVSGGILLNAEPSIPLILSIFDHHSEGHDGAMMIESGRISKFGLRLPLSTSSRLPEEIGTRHHASLGLAEASDAFIITVSEERRVITVFNDGEIISIKRREELREKIENHWKAGSSLLVPGFFNKKGALILEMAGSLLVAFALWVSIMSSVTKLKEITAGVPVAYKLADTMVITGDFPKTVNVKLSGTMSLISSLRSEDIIATVNLTKAMPGEVNVSIGRNNLELPQGINLVDVEPANFNISIHSYVQQIVQIKPQLLGSVPVGYELESVSVSPEKIPALSAVGENASEEDIFLTTTPVYLQTITQKTKLICKIIAPQGIIPAGNKEWPDVIVMLNVNPQK